MLGETHEKKVLITASVLLFVAFVFSVVGVATPGWSDKSTMGLLQEYNAANEDDKSGLLWLVGVVVLMILAILTMSFTAVIIVARFFGHSNGRAKLGGFLGIFSACILIISLGIYMGVNRPSDTTYGYSFALSWVAVPLSAASGVLLFLIKDQEFLKSRVDTMGTPEK